MKSAQDNRRSFLKKNAAGIAGIAVGKTLSPGRVLGANERINIASIGCGGRGSHLMQLALKFSRELNVSITGVADVWKPAIEKNAAILKEQTGRNPVASQRYRDLLNHKDVDAVIIATPDFAHSPILAEAAGAGKHAYVEKPMATNMRDANAAVDAVVKNNIVCQVGTQRRSSIAQQNGKKLIQSNILGVISEVECCYNRNTPSWRRGFSDIKQQDVDWKQYLMDLPEESFNPRRYRCWHLYEDFTNGLAGLLGAHVIDVPLWYMDDPLPSCGVALGGNLVWGGDRELADTMEALYLYPKGFMVRFVSRLGNSHGGSEVVFRGTNGSFDTGSLTATGEGGAGDDQITKPIQAEGAENAGDWADATAHMRNWLECIRADNPKTNADVHAGYAHSVAAILAYQSIKTGRRLAYDAQTRQLE
ncbi:MAG: Gfo/Idh/MocA family oxidoreductase [Candidatus Omnitrophica bacterium]|nr:Gfo/Idh/MocA family oxidoreductase [Candidatus Omnitrophota bacterium]